MHIRRTYHFILIRFSYYNAIQTTRASLNLIYLSIWLMQACSYAISEASRRRQTRNKPPILKCNRGSTRLTRYETLLHYIDTYKVIFELYRWQSSSIEWKVKLASSSISTLIDTCVVRQCTGCDLIRELVNKITSESCHEYSNGE